MKSIIQPIKDCCYLCGRNGNGDPLDEHHVFFGPFRKKSEKYGLKVYLCHARCHQYGEEAVHANADVDRRLKERVQSVAMSHYKWTIDQFREIFGKNYIQED